jgi:hypothetical protein
MTIWILLGLLLVIVAIQAVTVRESFAAPPQAGTAYAKPGQRLGEVFAAPPQAVAAYAKPDQRSGEAFAATSPGTLTQLVTSRPVYYLAAV